MLQNRKPNVPLNSGLSSPPPNVVKAMTTTLKLAQKYFLRSKIVVHTTPEIILADLINPKSDIRTKGFEKSIKSGIPTPRIIYQSPKNKNNTSDDPHQLTIVVSYRISASNNKHVLEFFHCYAAIGILWNDFMLAFSTIKAEVLPPDCDSLEVMRKDIDKKFIVTSGWDEMGNYYLKNK